MTAQILDGKTTAKALQTELAAQIKDKKEQKQRVPGLAVILVGDDAASQIYVQKKA